jgi:serine/threonine-protein kinase PpkA
VLYEMLTGHKPFTGLTAMDLMQQHVSGERPALPPGLCAYEPVVTRLMARERDDRYPDMDAVLADLDSLAIGAAQPAELSRHTA